jgi:hypothetical protein
VQRRALSIPEPGAIAISPGRRVFRPLTRCHRLWPWLPGSDQPTRRARPSRSRIAVPPYSPPPGLPGTVWVRPATRRTADAPCAVAVSISCVSCAARVGLARPTQQVVDGPLGVVLAARGSAQRGPCGDLEQHVHDQHGNQVRGLDPAQRRRKKPRIRRLAFPLVMAGSGPGRT